MHPRSSAPAVDTPVAAALALLVRKDDDNAIRGTLGEIDGAPVREPLGTSVGTALGAPLSAIDGLS